MFKATPLYTQYKYMEYVKTGHTHTGLKSISMYVLSALI